LFLALLNLSVAAQRADFLATCVAAASKGVQVTIQRLFTRKRYESRREKQLDFAIGFGGYIVLNALVQGIGFAVVALAPTIGDTFQSEPGRTVLTVMNAFIGLLPWLINIILLIYFGFTRHWIALGALAVIAAGLLLAIFLMLLFLAACFGLVLLGNFAG
jgi:hypothetical protein